MITTRKPNKSTLYTLLFLLLASLFVGACGEKDPKTESDPLTEESAAKTVCEKERVCGVPGASDLNACIAQEKKIYQWLKVCKEEFMQAATECYKEKTCGELRGDQSLICALEKVANTCAVSSEVGAKNYSPFVAPLDKVCEQLSQCGAAISLPISPFSSSSSSLDLRSVCGEGKKNQLVMGLTNLPPAPPHVDSNAPKRAVCTVDKLNEIATCMESAGCDKTKVFKCFGFEGTTLEDPLHPITNPCLTAFVGVTMPHP